MTRVVSDSTMCYALSVTVKSPRVREHRGHGTNRTEQFMQDNLSIPHGHCHCGCAQLTKLAPKTNTAMGWVKGEPQRFLRGHHTRLLPKPLDYIVDAETGCWVWQRHIMKGEGYGRLRVGGRTGRMTMAHRHYYERHVGPIPEGLCLDHLCRNRACVNPAHLEPVTWRENILRGEGAAVQSMRRARGDT